MRELTRWLSSKSDTGSFLMDDDGLVSRKEFLLANIIIILLVVGSCAADGALWLTCLCAIFIGAATRELVKVDEENNNSK